VVVTFKNVIDRNTIFNVSLSSSKYNNRKNAKNAQSFKVLLDGSKTESDKYALAYFNIQSTQSNYGDGNKECQSFKLYIFHIVDAELCKCSLFVFFQRKIIIQFNLIVFDGGGRFWNFQGHWNFLDK
jgi:hypothetical protein